MSSDPKKNQSEIAQLRERIAREHQAASWAINAPALGTAQHRFISRRMEQIGVHQQRLSALIGKEASMDIVLRVFDDSPPQRKEDSK